MPQDYFFQSADPKIAADNARRKQWIQEAERATSPDLGIPKTPPSERPQMRAATTSEQVGDKVRDFFENVIRQPLGKLASDAGVFPTESWLDTFVTPDTGERIGEMPGPPGKKLLGGRGPFGAKPERATQIVKAVEELPNEFNKTVRPEPTVGKAITPEVMPASAGPQTRQELAKAGQPIVHHDKVNDMGNVYVENLNGPGKHGYTTKTNTWFIEDTNRMKAEATRRRNDPVEQAKIKKQMDEWNAIQDNLRIESEVRKKHGGDYSHLSDAEYEAEFNAIKNRNKHQISLDEPVPDIEIIEDAPYGINASTASPGGGSLEEINRARDMKAAGQKYEIRNRGTSRPATVDRPQLRKGEQYGIVMPDGSFKVLDRGE